MPASMPGDGVGDDLGAADVDAGEARRLLVAADGVDVAAEGGEAQHGAVDEDGGEEEEAGDRHDAADEAAQDVELGHGVGAGVDRAGRRCSGRR